MTAASRLFLLGLLSLGTAAHADIIRGTVTDADDNAPIAGAKITLDATHYALTGADGKYELNTDVVGLLNQVALPRLFWDGATEAFRWDKGYGDVTVEVRDIKGNLAERFSSRNSTLPQSYAYGVKAAGIHFATFKTERGVFRFRVSRIGNLPLMVREELAGGTETVGVSAALVKTAATNNLTFDKADYASQSKTVNGSMDGVNVQLKRGPIAVINNGLIEVSYTRATGAISAKYLASGLVFIKSATLSQNNTPSAKVYEDITENNFTGGKTIEITYADGNKDRLLVFPGSQFAYFKKWLSNKGTADLAFDKITQVTATVDAGKPATSLKGAGTDIKLTGAAQQSYAFLALADPATRNGVVGAWVTTNISIGIVNGNMAGTDATLTGVSEFGSLRIKAAQTREGDMFAIGYFDDARLGLEANANDIAKAYAVKMKDNQVVFCTWQSVGGEGSQTQMAATGAWLKTNLVPFGFSVAQIDDGWQVSKRRFDDYNHTGSYSNGMDKTAATLKTNGLTAGLWFMPFAGNATGDPFFTPMFLKDNAGNVETSGWANTSLDPSLPSVQSYIKTVTDNIYNKWGYNYFKVDGMFTGIGAHQNYINDTYKTDDFFFAAKYSDPYKTNVEIYRNAWKIIRDNAPNAFIMGCTIAQNMRTMSGSFGILDALRIGPDGQDTWDGIVNRGIIRAGRRYFYNGRAFWIDPDPVFAHDTFGQTMCSYNAFVGYMYTPAEKFETLTAPQVDLLKRTMPFHGSINVRPVDFFDRDNPSVWMLTDDTHGVRRDVIGVFNMDQTNALVGNYTFAKLGLPGTQYVGFDFWANKFVAPFSNSFSVAVQGAANRIVALRQVTGNPMVVSTNRHVSQGIQDIVSETWDASTKTLSGVSKVVGGDNYELRIYAANSSGGNWTAGTATVSSGDTGAGVTIVPAQTGPEVRVAIKSATSRNVSWSIVFN